MCGRFTLSADGETIRNEFGLPEVPFDYRPRYNIAPLQDVLAIVATEEGRRAGWMRWGLVPYWSQDASGAARMINARSETVTEKSVFRDAFERRRCLIPADGFYEWQKIGSIKIPMRIRRHGDELFAFAGLWDRWKSPDQPPLISCTILTSEPSPLVAPIHDRMPVLLTRADAQLWLKPDASPAELKQLLQPYRGGDLEAYAVSQRVNRVENDSPECIESAAPPVPEQRSLF